MTREIKVNYKWQGKKQVPSISLQGIYLQEFGFDIDDKLKVYISKNEVIIKRDNKADLLEAMMSQNPALSKLVEEFELTVNE